MSKSQPKEKHKEELLEPQETKYPLPDAAQQVIAKARMALEQQVEKAHQAHQHTINCIAIGAGVPEGQMRLSEDGKSFLWLPAPSPHIPEEEKK